MDSFIQVAPFPPCGEGLKTLKPFQAGEFIFAEKFDVCALNDGEVLNTHCNGCLKSSVTLSCSSCKMIKYCSESCRKKDARLHEYECTLGERLQVHGRIPTRSQRLLLRFLKSGLNSDISFNIELIDTKIQEYLMMGVAVIKKYLPEITTDHSVLLIQSCQLRCSCFEIGDIGIGYSNCLKKINHCCDPNVLAEFSQDSVALFALKDIEAGSQLTISYVDDSKTLTKLHHFKCQCDSCRK